MRKSKRHYLSPFLQSTRKNHSRESLWKKCIEKGIRIEQIDHPQLSYIEAKQIAEQELLKDPSVYDK